MFMLMTSTVAAFYKTEIIFLGWSITEGGLNVVENITKKLLSQ